MNTINFLKGVIFYITVMVGCFTLVLDYDNMSFANIVLWFMFVGGFGFLTYGILKSSSKEDIDTFTGINFIKNKFGVDLNEE